MQKAKKKKREEKKAIAISLTIHYEKMHLKKTCEF